ncbi:carbohydrate ABC transporter permease [Paenibacillus silvisoli]|uniref:carbohydrate ABC transporter permease n=1 Tax=Paenibacillus silvisoli TaxID=3110539 RepID=UPI0028057EAA|nr:carbohydrate ABC transporter permease [Paenibacillus silvisoli]
MRQRSLGGSIFDISNLIFMVGLIVVMFYPFIYVFSYSFSEPGKLTGGMLVLPHGFNLDAYQAIFQQRALLHGIFVSVARTIIGPIVMIMITSMAAYVLTRDELGGVKLIRKFFVFTMYFSSGLIPMYLVIKSAGLIGTFWVYIIPASVSVFNMILIKTYIESVPKSLEEAALIDGANDFELYWKVIFPICMPVTAAVVLFTAVEQWNSFIDTQIYNVMNPEYHTLQYLLYQTVSGAASLEQAKMGKAASLSVTPESIKMAITIITVLPIVLVYPLLQKHFTKGLLIGSIKG